MADKKCLCDGLSLLSDMLDIYELYMQGIPESKKLMVPIAEKFHTHLSRNISSSDYDDEREKLNDYLQKFRRAINESRYGDYPTKGIEVIRDNIHVDPLLKNALVCERPGDRGRNYNIIETVMELLAEQDPGTAKEPLEQHVKDVTCTTME